MFQAAYSIAPAAAVPEPGYSLVVPILLAAIVFGRRFANRRGMG